jgi:prepilin-type N-terminal cleavage/methylation domain-containing protein
MDRKKTNQIIDDRQKSAQKSRGLLSTVYRLPSTVSSPGFTLIELLVSVGIFTVVMLIAAGSLLSMIEANRKAQSLKSVVNNLSFGLDEMARTIRDGRTLHCGAGDVNTTLDCSAGDTLVSVEKYGGTYNDSTDQYVYCLGSIVTSLCDPSGTSLLRSTTGPSGPFLPITAPEVTITQLRFYVAGSSRTDRIQPRVVMVLRGVAGANARIRTEIKLETTMTQRLYDE